MNRQELSKAIEEGILNALYKIIVGFFLAMFLIALFSASYNYFFPQPIYAIAAPEPLKVEITNWDMDIPNFKNPVCNEWKNNTPCLEYANQGWNEYYGGGDYCSGHGIYTTYCSSTLIVRDR